MFPARVQRQYYEAIASDQRCGARNKYADELGELQTPPGVLRSEFERRVIEAVLEGSNRSAEAVVLAFLYNVLAISCLTLGSIAVAFWAVGVSWRVLIVIPICSLTATLCLGLEKMPLNFARGTVSERMRLLGVGVIIAAGVGAGRFIQTNRGSSALLIGFAGGVCVSAVIVASALILTIVLAIGFRRWIPTHLDGQVAVGMLSVAHQTRGIHRGEWGTPQHASKLGRLLGGIADVIGTQLPRRFALRASTECDFRAQAREIAAAVRACTALLGVLDGRKQLRDFAERSAVLILQGAWFDVPRSAVDARRRRWRRARSFAGA